MALPYVKIPGGESRSLKNAVPGLGTGSRGSNRPLRGAVLGISTKTEKRRKRIGRALGWTAFVLALLFLIGGVVRLALPVEVLEVDRVRAVFGTLGALTAIGVHFALFAAEALQGRDAPRAVLAVVVFWGTFVVCGLY